MLTPLMPTRTRAAGFTLTEMMIAIAVAGVLLAVALPQFNQYLANSRVRATAESLQAGLDLARAEAIKRNRNVEFLLFGDAAYDIGMVDAVVANAAGPNWLVRARNPATGAYEHLDWQSGYEGSARSESAPPATTIAAAYPAGLNPAQVVAFNSLGGTTLTGAATYAVSKPDAGACVAGAPSGPIRCLQVQVSVGGQVRLCDPSVAAEDSRACN